ncbi:phage major capsid protein, HK97 family [Rickettsia hoogstraalii str. RCCE3]|nr:phage major capsid protein, HK97 family [Rickettsia hoogstraalii str. RCCE3]
MEAMINNKVKAGVEAIELIKQGAIDGLSIGFYIKNSVYNDARQRVITEAELLEISIVTFPANQSAKILYITKGQEIEYNDKINELEEKLYNMQNILERPNSVNIEEQEQKTAFINYVRKGEDNELMQKSSLNSSTKAGGVLILQTLYNSIITEINARSPMRGLASIETISTNALDIISEDGKFSSGWIGEVEAREETTAAKLKQQRIFVHELYAQPKASQALLDDATIRVENWLGVKDCVIVSLKWKIMRL